MGSRFVDALGIDSVDCWHSSSDWIRAPQESSSKLDREEGGG